MALGTRVLRYRALGLSGYAVHEPRAVLVREGLGLSEVPEGPDTVGALCSSKS